MRGSRTDWRIWLLAMVAAVVSGCGWGGTSENGGQEAAVELDSARAVLEAMVAKYQGATTYRDAGVVELEFTPEEGDPVAETADFSVTYERPGRLRMHCYQGVSLYSDGQVRAYLSDLEGQVLTGSYDGELSIEKVYFDDVLTAVLTQGIAGPSPQVGLLLEDDPLTTMLEGAEEPVLLEAAEIEGARCYRVRIPRSDGDLVAWVDRATLVLRRLEYPVRELKAALEQQGTVAGLRLSAEFRGAEIDTKIDAMAFRFETPSDAELVTKFRLTPPPQPPSPLLGKAIGEFEFSGLDGAEVNRESLAGKVVVLDFWASWCGPCLESLPNLQEVYEQFADDVRVEILAVSIDESSVDNATLTKAFDQIGVKIPIARDLGSYVQQVFEVKGIPNMFVLGPDGTVQDNEEGFHPDLATTLPGKIERLLAGEELHAEAWARYEQRKKDYEAAVEAEENGPRELPKVEIASQSEPSTLRLARLWLAEDLGQAGNILPYEEDGEARFLVNDGYRAVAILDGKGEVLATHNLPLADGAVISMFRTAVGGDGARYFVGTASAQKQAYLFDANWELVLAYPKGDAAEVADAQLADLDGDGTLELLVSYWGTAGVECVGLDGTKRWSAGGVENVFRMAVAETGDGTVLWCAHQGGTVLPIDATGKVGEGMRVGTRFVRHLIRGEESAMCGLAPTGLGTESVIGIGADGSEAWDYALPEGVHEQPIEMLAAAPWEGGDDVRWLVACADGSIHVLNAAGTLVDRFNYGSGLRGIAGARIDGTDVLLVASEAGVEALSVNGGAAQAAGGSAGPALFK